MRELEEWLGIETLGEPDVERMAVQAVGWANSVKRGEMPHWLVFLGKSGTGKTHIMDRLWRFCETQPGFNPPQSLYCPRKVYWPDFVDRLRGGNGFELYEDMKRWPFLYIDDAWAQQETEFSEAKLSTLIGCRTGRWTMVTANADMRAIAKKDVRISSRFMRDGCRVVDVQARDYNLRKRQLETT